MKLVQLNAWGGRLIYNTPRFIKNSKPDIVCLQEIFDDNDGDYFFFRGLKQLAEMTDMDNYYMAPRFSMDFHGHETQYGVGMLSNISATSQETIFTTGEYIRHQKNHKITWAQNFQYVRLNSAEGPINIINVHGTLIPGSQSKAGTDQTRREIAEIAEYASRFSHEPVIITGDLNLEPSSPSLEPLNTQFRNLPVEYGLTSTYSTVLHQYTVVCDYIYINDHVHVNSFSMPPDEVSDHKALVLDFSVS